MDLRKFPRRATFAAALALAFLCAWVQAAAPQLPPSAIADDTFMVATVDVAKFDPASLDASAKVILGASYAFVAEGLAKYKAQYEAYAGTGAESVTFVVGGDPAQNPEPIFYVKLKAGADHAALEKKIRDEAAKEGKPVEAEFSNDGDFMVMRKKGTKLPEAGSPDRARAFAEIVANSDKAFTLALNPTEKVRAKMKEDLKNKPQQQPWMTAMAPLLIDSKWMLMDAKLGEAPVISMTVQAADEAGAAGIADSVTQGGQQLKTQADEIRQKSPQFAGMADALVVMADALKPVKTGSKVSVSIEGKVVGPVVSNLLPLLMMGGAGGGPRPGANPGQ